MINVTDYFYIHTTNLNIEKTGGKNKVTCYYITSNPVWKQVSVNE